MEKIIFIQIQETLKHATIKTLIIGNQYLIFSFNIL